MSATRQFTAEVEPAQPKSEWTRALEWARDEFRKACAAWEDDGTDERSCEEVAIDVLNSGIVRGPQ